ncbi:arylesterase [Haematospirillum jordaniae]|uniref:arylesterase n=1 Tax=Haematospirillum jordaniae TaxID=1549855 RepID=UPI0009EEB11D|nr:arylesterase [Haematospirillum jordaniae]NKD44685.1 arylesterase [Haematospirillum jordaniae]NKD57705.1 arylesterase [Haematospirillum jordaniae]NKD59275.1 arylesterase [Haematospirillum jordaniae]NKD67413.1 arylesterase [Haematospirillum jordaniae]NKD79446.1 arylesterase [Haematospirillum jordaniae]
MALFLRLPAIARVAGAALFAYAAILSPVNGTGHAVHAADTGPSSSRPRLMALGDSLMAGYNLPSGQSVPDQLARILEEKGMPVTMINAGVSGDTSAGGLARLDWMLKESPDIVMLGLGANDALRGIDPKDTRINLNTILHRLRRDNIAVLLLGMLAPPNMGKEYTTEFNAIFPELAVMHNVPLVPFFLDGVAGNPTLLQADGMHPTERGTEAIARHILPWVESLTATRKGAPREALDESHH